MGLIVSHGCFDGGYIKFHHWRSKVAEVAGYGNLEDMEGYEAIGVPAGSGIDWPSFEEDPLVELLRHSDCDGKISYEKCSAIANRLESILPSLLIAEKLNDTDHYHTIAKGWVKGLRNASQLHEDIEFF